MESLPKHSFIRQPLLETPEVYHGGSKGIKVWKVDKSTCGNIAGIYVTTSRHYAARYAKPDLYKLYIPEDATFVESQRLYQYHTPKVQALMDDICLELDIKKTKYFSGSEMYKKIREKLGWPRRELTSQRDASKYLASKGIDGFIYDSSTIAGTSEGHTVYIIFNPTIIQHLGVEKIGRW